MTVPVKIRSNCDVNCRKVGGFAPGTLMKAHSIADARTPSTATQRTIPIARTESHCRGAAREEAPALVCSVVKER